MSGAAVLLGSCGEVVIQLTRKDPQQASWPKRATMSTHGQLTVELCTTTRVRIRVFMEPCCQKSSNVHGTHSAMFLYTGDLTQKIHPKHIATSHTLLLTVCHQSLHRDQEDGQP
jgi:hypothetical protein